MTAGSICTFCGCLVNIPPWPMLLEWSHYHHVTFKKAFLPLHAANPPSRFPFLITAGWHLLGRHLHTHEVRLKSAAGVTQPLLFRSELKLTFPHGSLSLTVLVRSIPTENGLTREKGRLKVEFPKRGSSTRWSFISTPAQNTAVAQMDMPTLDVAFTTKSSYNRTNMRRWSGPENFASMTAGERSRCVNKGI